MSTRVVTGASTASPPHDTTDLRGRLYAGICLAAGILSSVVIFPVNAIQDLPPIVNVGTFCFAVYSFVLYLWARRGRVYPGGLLLGLLTVLNVGWFPNAGSQGSIAYYFFAAIGLPVIFYTGWRRWLLFAIVVGNMLALFLIEASFPDLVRHFKSDHDRMVDLMANAVVASVVSAIVLRVVINAYLAERTRLATTLATLAESQRLESLGRLAGGVAHDFNNMLAGIMGHADLLLDDETSGERRERLRAILTASRRSADLAAKLLAFGRRGRNVVEAVDLNAIARDAVAMLEPSFPRDLELAVDWGARCSVDGDPSQLNQVVVNLCMNAIDAMPDGGHLSLSTADVELDATAAAEAGCAAGAYVMLRVRDTGTGMSEAVKARIFEPFFTTREHNRTSGSGLGLSTVHGVVHLHQGAITVESSPGAGATFTVWLPQGHLTPAPKVDAARAAQGRGCILIVDDEAPLRTFVAAALRKLGYESVAAVDGEDAVRVFAEHGERISAVLLDLKMPRQGGRETFLELRRQRPQLPVLICSGYGDNDEVQELIALGARGLLAKPFRIADLSDQLASIV